MGTECMSFSSWRESTQSSSSSCLFSCIWQRLSNFEGSTSDITNLLLWQMWWQFIKRLKHKQVERETDMTDTIQFLPFIKQMKKYMLDIYMLICLASASYAVSWCTFSADYKGVCTYFLPVKAVPCYNQVPAPVSFDRFNKLYALNLSVQGYFYSRPEINPLVLSIFSHLFPHLLVSFTKSTNQTHIHYSNISLHFFCKFISNFDHQ